MGPGRGVVQVVRSNHFVFDSFIVQQNGVLSVVASEYEQVFNGELITLAPANFETRVMFAAFDVVLECLRVEQVKHFFVVNLKERAIYGETLSFCLSHEMVKSIKQMFYASWNDTVLLLVTQEWICTTLLHFETVAHCWTVASQSILLSNIIIPMGSKHSKCLTRTRLSISKNS